jgi:SH3 domain
VFSKKAIAIKDYQVDSEKLLSFEQGDQIDILNRTSAEWWSGKIRGTQRAGRFPADHVKMEIDLPEDGVIPPLDNDVECTEEYVDVRCAVRLSSLLLCWGFCCSPCCSPWWTADI